MDTPAPAPLPSASSPAAERGGWFRQSVGVKIFLIAAIVLALLIPLALLQGLIRERQMLRDEAQREVSAMWGQAQTLGGPVLSVPYLLTRTENGKTTTFIGGYAHFLPDDLDIDAMLQPEIRRRGIYEVVLYQSDVTLTGSFGVLDPDVQGIGTGVLQWDRAVLTVGIPDLAGLKSLASVTWQGEAVSAEPGVPTNDLFASGLSFSVPVTPDAQAHTFRLALDLNGSTALTFLPFGKTTTAHVSGSWGSPSFMGAFVPDSSDITESSFEARWTVLYLNRNYPQRFVGTIQGGDRAGAREVYLAEPGYGGVQADGGALSAFGVRLLVPLDEYQKAMRSAEYGFLCLILTFVAIFFVEILGRRRIHPLQYLLVGCAVALFYLLLLSFSEYMAFNGAYGLAMLAVLTLVLLYTRAIFHSWQYAGIVTGLLVVFYGYFFVLLQLEAYALLFGSLGLLVILALVMYLSRNVDWYSVGVKGADEPT